MGRKRRSRSGLKKNSRTRVEAEEEEEESISTVDQAKQLAKPKSREQNKTKSRPLRKKKNESPEKDDNDESIATLDNARQGTKKRSPNLSLKKKSAVLVQDDKFTQDEEKQSPSTVQNAKQLDIREDYVLKPWTRSNDPHVLDAPPTTMTLADRGALFRLDLVSPYSKSKIRQFSYPARSWTIKPWPSWFEGGPFQEDDPFHDFTPCMDSRKEPHPLRFHVGNQDRREVLDYVQDPKLWFRMDHLSYYTYWSSMYTTDYTDEHDYFGFYMAGGETSSMYYWFDESTDSFDDSDVNVAKIVSNIWKKVHPPSYYLFRQLKIDASSDPKNHGYNTGTFRKMKKVFQDVDQTFSIMKKRVISIVVGDNMHFTSYLAVNFGAHFKEGSAADREPSFIANLDSFGGGESNNTFVYWMLSVIYELEVWVTEFLNTPPGVVIVNPKLADIGRKCKKEARSLDHLVCAIPIQHVTRIPQQTDTWNCGIFAVMNARGAFLADINHHVSWPLVINTEALWLLVLKPFWALPTNPLNVQGRINERVTKFRSSLTKLLLGESFEHPPSDDRKKPPKSNVLAEASASRPLEVPSGSEGDTLVAGKTAGNCLDVPSGSESGDRKVPPPEIVLDIDVNTVVSALDKDAPNTTPTMDPIPKAAAVSQSPPKDNGSSDSDSDFSLTIADLLETKIYPDMTKDGKFFYQLQEKAKLRAQQTKRRRLRRARWLRQSEGMSYDNRQAFFKKKHEKREAKQLEANRPQLEAKAELKRKNSEWKDKAQEISDVFCKRTKLVQKDKKQVMKLLEEQFPDEEIIDEPKDTHVTEISHLKYVPPLDRDFTLAEKRKRHKYGQETEGYKMHVSPYFQGLSKKRKGESTLVDQINHLWVRDCFAAQFVTLVMDIGKEETRGDIQLKNRKWIPVPIGDAYSHVLDRDLEVDVKVHYQQGEMKTCLYRSLASAFHHVGSKHTGSVLASMAMQNLNLPSDEQLKSIIAAVRRHETVYKKVDYWKKQKVIARQDFIGEPNDNPKLLVLRGCDGGVSHAVAVVGRTIFDSNLKKGLALSKESLDWCSNCSGGLERVQTVLQFRK